MGKSKKLSRHHMEDDLAIYKKIRKPKCKPTRVIDDSKKDSRRFDWRKELED